MAFVDNGPARIHWSAVGKGPPLLLVMGLFGHNLFRFTWLWYGGFLIIARHVVAAQALLGDLEAEDATVERQRPLQVGDFQVNVADSDLRINRVTFRC